MNKFYSTLILLLLQEIIFSLICDEGKYDKGGTCEDCSQNLNCKSCSDETQCVTCNTDQYYLSNKICCKYGFYNNNNTCQECSVNCHKCENVSSCQECSSGFFKEGDNCTKCIDNCKTCETKNTCQVCNDIFFLDSQKKCECKDGYYLKENKCEECDPTLNCITCNSIPSCKTCKTDFFLQDSSKCVLTCKNGTIANSNKECISCVKGCKECSSVNECKTCENVKDGNTCLEKCQEGKYQDSNNECKVCPPELNCINCKDQTQCNENGCNQDFKFDDEKKLCIPNCGDGKYMDNEKKSCQDCLKDCKICDNGNSCKECTPNKYFESGVCVDCNKDWNCKVCSGNQKCESCNENEGFILSQNKCLCKDSKVLEGGACKDCPTNCKKCQNSQICTDCNDGYSKQDNKCVKSVCKTNQYMDQKTQTCTDCKKEYNCKACNDGDSCSDCKEGFTLKEKICQCNEGYYPDKEICQACTTNLNCKTCNDAKSCKDCKDDGFTLKENTCQCKEGKYLNNGSCKDCLSNCLTCTDSQKCTKCKDGYKLEFFKNDKCLLLTDPNCKIYNDMCVENCYLVLQNEDKDKNQCQDCTKNKKINASTIECVEENQILKEKCDNIEKIIGQINQVVNEVLQKQYTVVIKDMFETIGKDINDIPTQETQTSNEKLTNTDYIFKKMMTISTNLVYNVQNLDNKQINIITQAKSSRIVSQRSAGKSLKKKFKINDFDQNKEEIELFESSTTTTNILSVSVGYLKKNIFCKKQCTNSLPYFSVNTLTNGKRVLEATEAPYEIDYQIASGQDANTLACVSNEGDSQVKTKQQQYDSSTSTLKCFFYNNVFVVSDPDCNFRDKSECEQSVKDQKVIIIILTVAITLLLCFGYFLNECQNYYHKKIDKDLLLNQSTTQDLHIDMQNMHKENNH